MILDELAQWNATPQPRRLFEATTSAMGKVPGSRLVILTSAGDPAHWAHGVLEHAQADELWHVHEVRGPAPWMDEARLNEQRRRLPASSFARLFRNEWTAPEDRLTTVDDLAACTLLDGPLPPEPGKRYVIGLDVGTVNDRTVASVCHAEPITRTTGDSGDLTAGVRVVLDRMQVWAGSRARPVQLADVGEWVEFTAREYGGAPVVFDPHQAIELTQRLRRRGIRCEQFTFSAQSVGRLALTLYQLLRSRSLALPDDPELLDELAHVRLRETAPGAYRLDHDPDRHDDRAIALALAAHRLVERAPRGGGGVAGVVEHRSLMERGCEEFVDPRFVSAAERGGHGEPDPVPEAPDPSPLRLGPRERRRPGRGMCRFCGSRHEDQPGRIGRGADVCMKCLRPENRPAAA